MYEPVMPPRTLSSLRESAKGRYIKIDADPKNNRVVSLVGASEISDDDVRDVLDIPEHLRYDTSIWSHGCNTCGYGYTVEVGLPYEVIIDCDARDER